MCPDEIFSGPILHYKLGFFEKDPLFSIKTANPPGHGTAAQFEEFLTANAAVSEQGTWTCFLCGKQTLHSGNMRQHFEAHHFSIGLIQCAVCSKIFKTRHSLATHMSKNHRDQNKI